MKSASEWLSLFDFEMVPPGMRLVIIQTIQRDALEGASEVILRDATPDSDRIPSIARNVLALLPPSGQTKVAENRASGPRSSTDNENKGLTK
jgi:hypothetical protein